MTILASLTVALGTGVGTASAAVTPMQGGVGCIDQTTISNVASAGQVTRSPSGPYWQVSGVGPATLTLSHANSVANTYSVTAGVNVAKISSAVGYNVTETRTVTTSYAYGIPAGQNWMVRADTVFNKKTFSWKRVHGCTMSMVTDTGTGYSLQFARLAYRAYQI